MAVLKAPAAWRTVDFISDLHLCAEQPETFGAWRNYLAHTPADAVFMLGDVFEVWVGDDVLTDALTASDSFESRCAQAMTAAAARLALFFMHGNRDFLVGQQLMARCQMRLLDDPTVFEFDSQRWLISHGDALCLDDVDYLAFRAQVRSPAWQATFLAKPLAERQAIARELRAQSEARKKTDAFYADVDGAAASDWLNAANATTLIHGHTHRPGQHALGDGLQRLVLSDWDLQAQATRAEVLRLSLATGKWQRLPVSG
jgi:UDP-2,3-diacylglucosamine hydrolase